MRHRHRRAGADPGTGCTGLPGREAGVQDDWLSFAGGGLRLAIRSVAGGLALLAAGILAVAAPTAAQQGGPADYWQALQNAGSLDELSSVSAPTSLEPLVAEALRLVRAYELDPVRRTAYRARWDLQRAVRSRPRDPWHQLALALVLRRGPDAHIRVGAPKSYHFVDPRSLASADALRALRTALELDPELELAAVELARFAVERHDAELLVEADAALAKVGPSAEASLQRAAIALERRDADSAIRYARDAAAAGADAGRVAHTRAVALLLDPATERMGAAAYIGGLDEASEAAVAEYHRAAAPVFTIAESEAWDRMSAGRRAAWLKELWQMRAALAGVSLPERLRVHFRRLYEAHAKFPLYAPLRDEMTASLAVLLGEEVRRHGLSPQGLMLTRYGDPSWLRWIGICGSVPYMPQRGTAGVLDAYVAPGATRPVDMTDVLMSETLLDEDVRRIRMLDCSNPSAVRQFAQWITEGDRYTPVFGAPLGVQLEVYAFRGEAGADVIAGITVLRQDVSGLGDASGRVTLNTAIALVDTAARRTSRSEQALRFALPAATASHILLAAASSTTLSGRLAVRATVADSARRSGAVLRLTHDIPDFSAGGLQLSDVVIAPVDASERLRRGDVGLAVAAGRKYARGESFSLYYEIYGLDPDARYRTSIVVAPAGSALWRRVQQLTGREQDVVTLRFEEQARLPHALYGVQELRTVGTGSLRPGAYRLQIEITDLGTGARSIRERLLDITDR